MLSCPGARGSHTVAVLTVLALFVFSSVCGRSCTLQTCPPGPVYVYFEHENCSGETRYSSWDAEFGVCENHTEYSFITRIHEKYVEEAQYSGSGDCGGGRSDAIVTRGREKYFGSCTRDIPNLRENYKIYGAYILLANVNDSYISPQPYIEDLSVPPVVKGDADPCTSPTDCQSKGSLFSQYFLNATCPADNSFFDVFTAMAVFKCYRGQSNYVMIGCLGPHAYEYKYYVDSLCSRPAFSTKAGGVCGTTSTSTSTSTTFCTATRPDNQTSSASNSLPIALFTIIPGVIFCFI